MTHATVNRIFMATRDRKVEFYAVTNERVQKKNLLPTTDVETGFPITQFSRRLPREGTLVVFLVDDLPTVTPTRAALRDLAQSSSILEFARRAQTLVPPSKEEQKEAIDFLFDLSRTKALAAYVSDMEQVPNVAVETLSYARDKRTNLFALEVQWREIKTARTATIAVELTGKLDPATNSLIDAPTFDQGFIVMGEQPTSEDVTVETVQTEEAWKQTFNTPG